MDQTLLDFAWVQMSLEQSFLTQSQVGDLLGLSSKSLNYWYTKAISNVKGETRYIDKRVWRRFSVLDLFAYGVIKELRRLAVQLCVCKRVVEWLRDNTTEKERILYPLSVGHQVILVVDRDSMRLHVGEGNLAICCLYPGIYLPLETIFRFVLERVSTKDFKVRFTNKNVAIYNIRGRPIVLSEGGLN